MKQGRNKSSDHYKIYIAPLLDTLDDADLGVWVGPVNVAVSGVADDVYIMSDNQTKLQSLLDIAEKSDIQISISGNLVPISSSS